MDEKIKERIKVGRLIGESLMLPKNEMPAELSDWKNSAAGNRRVLDEINNRAFIEDRDVFYSSVDSTAELDRFATRKRKKSGRRIALVSTAAAAAVVAIFAGIRFSVSDADTQAMAEVSVIQSGSVKAFLVSDDNRMLTLGENVSIMVKGGEIIRNQGEGGISYVAENDGTKKTMNWNKLITPNGAEYKVTLADGSRIHLNAATTLEYPGEFDGPEREVKLKGEAFFEVSRNEKPFIVDLDGYKIKVYGTSFNINTYALGGTQIVLVAGSVGVRNEIKGEEKMMSPSQMIMIDGGLSDPEYVDVSLYMSWTEGRYIFEDNTLEDILNTLSRWYDVEIDYLNPEVKAYRLVGSFKRNDNLNGILKAISRISGINFTIDGKHIMVL